MLQTSAFAVLPSGRVVSKVRLSVGSLGCWLVLLAAFLLCGCAANNVQHFDAAAKLSNERQASPQRAEPGLDEYKVVKIFLDRSGDLYPTSDWQAGDAGTYFGQVGAAATLWDTFSSAYGCSEGCNGFERPVFPATALFWNRQLERYNLDLLPTRRRCGEAEAATAERLLWARLQAGLRLQVAKEIDLATRRPGQSRKPVVMLVHGFNVADPAKAFEQWRKELAAAAGQRVNDFVFLDVAWDGLTGSGLLPPWSRAQYNFPLTGQGLRKLFASFGPLAQELDVRILTHSSGGPVVAHMLWNASGAESRNSDEYADWADGCQAHVEPYRDYLAREWAGVLPAAPSFKKLRVAMIVPAMPSSALRYWADPLPSPLDIFVIGWNRRDKAVTKYMGWFELCQTGGNTCLAASRAHVCAAEQRISFFHPGRASLVNLSEVPPDALSWPIAGESHDMEEYLTNSRGRRIIDGLLGASSASPGVQSDVASICGEIGIDPALRLSVFGQILLPGNSQPVLAPGQPPKYAARSRVETDRKVVSNNPSRLLRELEIERGAVYRSNP